MIEGYGPGEWIEVRVGSQVSHQGCLPGDSRTWSKSKNVSETGTGLLELVSKQDANTGAQDGPEKGGRSVDRSGNRMQGRWLQEHRKMCPG